MWNTLKTALLLGGLTLFLVWVGRSIGGNAGAAVALVLAVAMNLGSWWFSDRIVLSMYGAQPVTAAQAPELYGIVAELAARAKLPMPRVYILPQPAPNAFATGRDPAHAAVAVTEGLLRMMPPDEVRAVLAHELGHVRNRDTLIAAIAASMAGAISLLADVARWSFFLGGGRGDEEDSNPFASLVALLVAPFAAMLIQLAVSRSREYAADAWAAELIGDGEPLARALRRLESGIAHTPAHATPSTAHLFIVNPFTGRRMLSLFSTHPATEDRVAALMALDVSRRARRGWAV